MNSPCEHSAFAVRVSRIHGLGVFASREIGEGEFIGEYRGEIISREESCRRSAHEAGDAPVFRVAIDESRELDGECEENPIRHANHGCDANAELRATGDRLALVAARLIREGEEILFDYGFGLPESLGRPCRCGSPVCVGRIVAEPLRPLLKKHLLRRRAR